MTRRRSSLERWVLNTSDCLVELAAPRRENPVFTLLVRRWRRNLHGARNWRLYFFAGVAVVQVLLLPLGVGPFLIWHVWFTSFLLWPAFRFPYELRRGRGGVVDLLMTPLTSGRYVQALRGIFWLSALYAAVPYVAYWLALFALRPIIMPTLFSTWPNGVVVVSAVLHYAAVLSLLWLALWCAAAGGWWMLAPVLITPVAVVFFAASIARVVGIEPFPVSPAIWLLVLNLFIFGHLISRMLARSFVVRMREQA